jgi:predicted RNA-binding Zn-ribbon protein involved in translation (DUF1610 family)
MPKSRKVNLEKVRASLDLVCSKCGGVIAPADVRHIDFDRIECPPCGERLRKFEIAGRGNGCENESDLEL